MDGYLVLVSYMGEDIPTGLFATRDEAATFAGSLSWALPKLPPLFQPHSPFDAAYMWIVTFKNGKPVDRESVRDFDQECDFPPQMRLLGDVKRQMKIDFAEEAEQPRGGV